MSAAWDLFTGAFMFGIGGCIAVLGIALAVGLVIGLISLGGWLINKIISPDGSKP